MKPSIHQSVLLQPALEFLNIQAGGWYLDATAGGGGHTAQILHRGGNVLAIDRDKDAITRLREKFATIPESNLKIIHADFSQLDRVLQESGTKINGALFDFGLSSDQLETQERGFSFMREAPLDMRMDQSQVLTAAHVINTYSEKKLVQIFREYADMNRSESLVRKILTTRARKPFRTTLELSTFIESHLPRTGKIHPATTIFQALRIEVNHEYDQIVQGLPASWSYIVPQGRLVMITFHSGEDRIAKHFCEGLVSQKYATDLTPKPISPSVEEVRNNSRSRSAKLRAVEKLQ